MTAVKRHSEALVLLVGYALFKAASSTSYLSAMGTTQNLGFVTQLPFMLANSAAEAATALLLVLLASRGLLRPGRAPFRVGYLVTLLLAAVSVALVGHGPSELPVWASVAMGLAKGIGGSLLFISWFVLAIDSPIKGIAPVLAGVFVLDALFGMGLSAIPPSPLPRAVVLIMYAVSLVCAVYLERACARPDAAPRPVLKFRSADGRALLSAVLCLGSGQFIVGITNTAMFESSFSSVLAAVDVNVCMLVAAVAVGLWLLATRHAPKPENTFKVVMPILLAVFTLAAFMTERFGQVMGNAMIVCYEALAVTFSIYLVTFLRERGYDPVRVVGVTLSVTSLTLLAGLCIGILLNLVCDNHGVPLFTVLAFVAIYPLGIVLLYIQHARSAAPGSEGPAAEKPLDPAGVPAPAPEPVSADDVQEYIQNKVASFAKDYGLTRRETDVCTELIRGHTVKSIADDLGISENTAWTHIRNLYAKCSVNAKGELIALFESRE